MADATLGSVWMAEEVRQSDGSIRGRNDVSKDEHRQLLIDASVMYYLEGKNQSEIAKRLFVSRPKVSRLLKKAREEKIVEITINYDGHTFDKLRNQFRHEFKIEDILIAKTLSTEEETIEEVGRVAARKLELALKNDMILGISWGRNVRMTAANLTSQQLTGIKLVELFGAISYNQDPGDMLSIGRLLSDKVNGQLYPLPSPIFIREESARQAVVNTPIVRHSLQMIKNCDLIISGIGEASPLSNVTLWKNYVSDSVKRDILAEDGVGFICAHFFDSQGRFLDLPINKGVIGIDIGTLKRKKTMVVAGGVQKAKAILGALRGGYIDILVTDEMTINKVLEYNERDKK